MQLLAPRIALRLQKNHRHYVFAEELVVQIQRFRECFLGSALPSPTSKVIAAWNDLPNVTMSNLATSVKTGLVLLPAPPPTPTGFPDTSEPTLSDPSSNESHNNEGWLFVNDTASDVGVLQTPEGSTTSDDDSMTWYSCSDKPLDSCRQITEEDPTQSPDNYSLSSDQESSSSSGEDSPVPVGFDNMVSQWLVDYCARGTDAFIESLIAFGAISVGTAVQASRIARALIRKVAKVSYLEGKNLENSIRFSTLVAFKKYWESYDTSMDASFTQEYVTPPSPYGVNIATMMGGLFSEKISSAKDIHLCLTLLLDGEKRFDRLCAIHALLVQANDKLCKNRNLPALMQFKGEITYISKESGEYLWATNPQSKSIINDILSLIKQWMALQAHKREQSRVSFGTSSRTIRNSAVGPRLRNGWGRVI